MRVASVAAFALMVVGIFILAWRDALWAHRPLTIALQVAAGLLMVSARLTFGRRSFHAAADPTGGGLVTTGPYRILRHPIYAAVIYFMWAAAIDHASAATFIAAVLSTAGACARMFFEEQLLVVRYPEYRDYMRHTRRVIPFVL
jgi:protein-S-isoprenylcysteine O-methyltransferase Ste14